MTTFGERYRIKCRENSIYPCGTEAQQSLGCTKSYISKMMKSSEFPSVRVILAAADMLDVSTDYLLGRIDDTTTNEVDDYITSIRGSIEVLNSEGREKLTELINLLTRYKANTHNWR